ncbi:hypothetical protein C8Q79DRAFT_924097 [Trametes meyenii]|nr:hypothetical protein C8Q79DRAFT_924097 [Trametes meyenii]
MSDISLCDNFVFDLADVFHWPPPPGEVVTKGILRRMQRSLPAFEYERGHIDEEECCALLASQLAIPVKHVADTFQATREVTPSVDERMLHLLHRLKERPGVRLHCVYNTPAPNWEFLRRTISGDIWELFTNTLISANIGQRMPSLAFYQTLLGSSVIDPRRTALISSSLENVVSARSMGMTGVLYSSPDELTGTLRPLTRDSVRDGQNYLREHAGQMWSETDTGIEVRENFAQLLMLELTRDPSLVTLPRPERRWKFFVGAGVLTTKDFPADVDTTSIAHSILGPKYSSDIRDRLMDEILTLRSEDGIVLTYFDRTRPRTDPVVCVNTLTFFSANGRGDELPETFGWVYHTLLHRAYTSGTLYYHGPDPFLYFLSRLCVVAPEPLRIELVTLFKERITEQFGAPGDALALSMRIVAAASVGLCDRRDYDRLLAMQEDDGAWPTGWMYKYGASGILIGNRGLTTAMAVSAIQQFRGLQGEPPGSF